MGPERHLSLEFLDGRLDQRRRHLRGKQRAWESLKGKRDCRAERLRRLAVLHLDGPEEKKKREILELRAREWVKEERWREELLEGGQGSGPQPGCLQRDILEHIFSRLATASDVVAIRLVNKHWKHVVDTMPLKRLKKVKHEIIDIVQRYLDDQYGVRPTEFNIKQIALTWPPEKDWDHLHPKDYRYYSALHLLYDPRGSLYISSVLDIGEQMGLYWRLRYLETCNLRLWGITNEAMLKRILEVLRDTCCRTRRLLLAGCNFKKEHNGPLLCFLRSRRKYLEEFIVRDCGGVDNLEGDVDDDLMTACIPPLGDNNRSLRRLELSVLRRVDLNSDELDWYQQQSRNVLRSGLRIQHLDLRTLGELPNLEGYIIRWFQRSGTPEWALSSVDIGREAYNRHRCLFEHGPDEVGKLDTPESCVN